MTPHQALDPYDWDAIHTLLTQEFAEMEGRIDPPSSLRDLTASGIAAQSRLGEVWVIGTPPLACIFLSPKPDALYLGKVAVATAKRGQGLARQLVDLAQSRAIAMGLRRLELQTRVELLENHATFRALGFLESGRTAHPGYSKATSITFAKVL